ncbi:MAG: ABC transporter substrate-binding protein [Clostridiaceae bacterium]|nr:ABC transporter substrate-binding protein [Clostridiaceae bacterium]
MNDVKNEAGPQSEQKLTHTTGKLIVGSDTTYPPFEYIKDNEIVGFDIDIAGEIAERLDLEVEFKSIEWDSTFKIPEEIRLDMVVSAIPVMEEKKEFVDFSDPYFVMEYMLVTLKEAEVKIKEDLEGSKIGMLKDAAGSLPGEYLSSYQVESYNDVLLMFDDLKNKKIEGLLISVPIGSSIIGENNGSYSILEIVRSNTEFGIVFAKGGILKDKVNRVLSEIKEDGTYEEIYNRWFEY